MKQFDDFTMQVDLGEFHPTVFAGPNQFHFDSASTRQKGVPGIPNISENIDPEAIHQLLAGCIKAGWAKKPRKPVQPMGLREYVYSLCSSYHSANAAWPYFTRARDQFYRLGDEAAAEFAHKKAREEVGHDKLALKDLAALGLPAKRLIENVYPKRAQACRKLFSRISKLHQPYGVFGYTYMLERMSLFTTQKVIDQTQSLSPNGADITRCMRVHSSIGADIHHVRDLQQEIGTMPPHVIQQICRATYMASCTVYEERDDSAAENDFDTFLDKYPIAI